MPNASRTAGAKLPGLAVRRWIKRHRSAWRAVGSLMTFGESVIWGTTLRERALTYLLRRYYESQYRRLWQQRPDVPHFFNQRAAVFRFAFGAPTVGPQFLYRGFHSSRHVRPGHRVLDLGCGDGFFTSRFLAPQAAEVDAVDIEPSAIDFAKQWNAAPNVRYVQSDAVRAPFPRPPYDVIVWDGGIGHVRKEDAQIALQRIREALAAGGVFVGSESLGDEGTDHLQFFPTVDALVALLRSAFPRVDVETATYSIQEGRQTRTEAYWVCRDVQ